MASKNIPMEITTEILTLLPIKTLSRFKCVSKSWKSLIESPDFFKLHLKKSLKIDSYNSSLILTIHRPLTIDGSPIIIRALYRAYLDLNDTKLKLNKLVLPPSFETSPESVRGFRFRHIYREEPQKIVYGKASIAGSCNGLILILSGEHHIAICNPSIEQQNASFKILPCLDYHDPYGTRLRSYQINFEGLRYPHYAYRSFVFRVFGLGYDSYTHCYKIVSLTEKKAFIYTLIHNSRSWREIDLPDLEPISHIFTSGSEPLPPAADWENKLFIKPYNHGVATNNHLHWNITQYDPLYFECSTEKILSFDLRSEVWGEVQVPDELDQGYFLRGYIAKPYILELGVLNGSLCLLISRGISYPNLQLWVMIEYGVKESRTKLCNVPNGSGVPLVYRIERNEYLLTGTQQGLGWHNPKENRVRKVEFHGCEFTGEYYYSTRVTMCIESFVDPLTSIDGAGDRESSQEED